MKNNVRAQLSRATRGLAVLLLLAVPLYAAIGHASATNGPQLYLGPTSQTATTGSTVTFTLNMASDNSAIFAWQAYVSYSPAYFDSATVTTSNGSPFSAPAGNDVASNGTVSLSRYSTTAQLYDGAVAVITLHSNGTAGTAAVTVQHVCANNNESTGCSAMINGSGSNILNGVSGASVTLNAPAAAAGGSSSSSSSGGTVKTGTKTSSKSSAATPATVAAVAQSVSAKASSGGGETASGTVNVTIDVTDQNNRPVQHAQVVINGLTVYTDSNGRAVFRNVSPDATKAIVRYKGQQKEFPLQLDASSSQASQTARVTLDIAKASSKTPLWIGGFATGLAIFVALLLLGRGRLVRFFVNRRRQKQLESATARDSDALFTAQAPKPAAVTKPTPIAPPVPKPEMPAYQPVKPKPVVSPPAPAQTKASQPAPSPFSASLDGMSQQQPSHKPEAPHSAPKPVSQAELERQRAMAPGTIVRPNALGPQSL